MALPMASQRPPQLAPTLVLSGGLSVTTVYIAFVYHKLPDLWDMPYLAIPIANIAYTTYYLNRLIQLRNRFAPTQYESQKWPVLPMFPGNMEHDSLLTLAKGLCWTTWCYMSHFSSGERLSRLRWPKDVVDIVYRSIILVQGISTILVVIQARKLRRPEDRVLCEKKGHAWKCGRCQVLPQNETTKPTLPSPSYIARPDRTMKLSLLLCSMIVGLLQFDGNRAKMSEPSFIWLSIALPLLTFVHHAIFLLLHAKPSAKKANSQGSWPCSPHFTGKWKPIIYISGLAAAWFCWLISAFSTEKSSSRFWTYHWIIRSFIAAVWVSEIILLLLGIVEGNYMIVNERHAMCFQVGHAWKCSRICNAKLDTDDRVTSKIEVRLITITSLSADVVVQISASSPATP
jgi:hypothetical protein